jgi:amidase
MGFGTVRSVAILGVGLMLAGAAAAQAPSASQTGQFHLAEATIDGIHAEMKAGRLSCVRLVQLYLDRIAAYDQQGPALNAVQNVNRQALEQAAELDARFKAEGVFAPLACIPVVVKDEVNTSFMPTTYGSALFKSFVPERNATIIDRLQQAGALILAKTNMGEFASAYSGSAFGDCHNAYDPKRSPSGSSCGTGVAIAANFATIGIGEDTGGSIRGPAAHGSLVGLRPTLPLVSRAGMMPFAPTRDTLGPITRTVRDAAILLDVIAGYDAADPVTAESYGRLPDSYTRFLLADGLKGMRFGVIRHPMEKADTAAPDYQETQAAIDRALGDMRARGAEILDAATIAEFRELFDKAGNGDTYEPEAAIDGFLAAQKNPPFHSLKQILERPEVNARRREDLKRALGHTVEEAGYLKELQARAALRRNILKLMADERLDALVYATYDHAPAAVPVSTPGSNRRLASIVGFPAISLPAGFFADGMPIGLELMARPFDEATLFRAAYDYEQTTRHRRPPPTVPPLAGEP